MNCENFAKIQFVPYHLRRSSILHKKILYRYIMCIVLYMPIKAISMHAASCDRVVLVIVESVSTIKIMMFAKN